MLTSKEPSHDKTNKMACAPSQDSDQPGHPPSLIRVFTVRSMCSLGPKITVRSMGSWGPKISSCGQRRLWSDWGIRLGGCPGWSESSLDAQSFCWFCHEAAQIRPEWAQTKCESLIVSHSRLLVTRCCCLVDSEFQKIKCPKKHMSSYMTKPTKWVCAQRRLRSIWASAQSDQSLRCLHVGISMSRLNYLVFISFVFKNKTAGVNFDKMVREKFIIIFLAINRN